MRIITMSSTIASVAFIAAACASKPVETTPEPAPVVVSSDSPAGPPNMFGSDRAMVENEPAARAEKRQLSPFERTLKRMEKNPLTLYRSQRNAYTYYIGNVLEAEYKPERGLTLRNGANRTDNSLICKYNLEGGLNSASANPGQFADAQRACADLMFTFDKQLTE